MPSSRRRAALVAAALSAAIVAGAAPVAAMLDIDDRGPVLRAGEFSMRVSNVGVLGNPFIDDGRSFDPSFEYPSGSGIELMREVDLWVGGIGPDGRPHVSGAPRLELRPGLEPEDRVVERFHGAPGTRPLVDDDGDGRLDEETLDGRDDDGDGEVDEDLAVVGQQELGARYVDDRIEAVRYVYPGGETHQPLGVSVYQRVIAWDVPGYRSIAGLEYTITNHTEHPIRGLYLGLLADLDVRDVEDAAGHVNDRARSIPWSVSIPKDPYLIRIGNTRVEGGACITRRDGVALAAVDGPYPDRRPAIALVGLSHTIDPLEALVPGYGRAPARTSFRIERFANGATPGAGGLPRTDDGRYSALAGGFENASGDHVDDVVMLLSCGPFPTLAPGQSLELRAALVAASVPESLALMIGRAAWLHEGTELDLEPDSLGAGAQQWDVGRSGLNGHEACVEPPPGLVFDADPDCPTKFALEPAPPKRAHYAPGSCVWTDADCDACTGNLGRETVVRWTDPGSTPAEPRQRLVAGDHQVRIEWDNLPEILVTQGLSGSPGAHFAGYRVYKLADWRQRVSALPPKESWALLAAFGDDSLAGAHPLAEVTDTTLDYERVLYERKLYPPGRYHLEDRDVLDGFRYGYRVAAVTARTVRVNGLVFTVRDESPLTVRYEDTVTPRSEATARAGAVWVVPNPYRARADWELPRVPGDTFTRHLDFMGLPRARCRIRIWSLAGDLVAELEHDGRNGDGQASWDLVSRNGQDVASGVYVFTVTSDAGSQTGRFVVIR